MPADQPRSAAKPASKAAAKPASAAKRTAKVNPDAASKPVAPAKAPKADLKTGPKSDALRLKALVEAVASNADLKKSDAKRAVEAVLETLAAALKRGDDLNLPPLGRVRVAKSAEKDGVSTLTLKLRLGGGGKPGAKQGLADDGEDS